MLVGLLVASLGCSDDDGSDANSKLDCGQGTIEHDGSCVVECPDGSPATNGECVAPNGGEDAGHDTGDDSDAGEDAGHEFSMGPVSADPQTVGAGELVEIFWTSTGAESCEPTGELQDWTLVDPETLGTEGPASFEIPENTEPDTYEVGILCTADAQTLEEVTSVEVVFTDPCDSPDRQPPPGWNRLTVDENSCLMGASQTTTDGDCRHWNGIWQSSFIATGGNTRRLGLPGDSGEEYMAIEFTTEGLTPDMSGAISINTDPHLLNRRKLMSISSCPGDFHEESIAEDTGCYRESFTQSLNWGGTATGSNCQLERDETYYLNIIYTDSELGTHPEELEPHPDCIEPEQSCGNVINPIRN